MTQSVSYFKKAPDPTGFAGHLIKCSPKLSKKVHLVTDLSQILFECANMTPSVLLLTEDLCREMREGSVDSSCSPSSSKLWSGQQGSMIQMACGETVQ